MNIADIILLLVLLICGVVSGLKQGLVQQVMGIVALVAAVWLSCRFASALGVYLAPYINLNVKVVNAISFAAIFMVVFYVLYLFGIMLRKVVKVSIGGWIDRLLGVLFALFKVCLILGLLILLFDAFNQTFGFVSQSKVNQSVVYVHIKNFTNVVFPYLKLLISKGQAA